MDMNKLILLAAVTVGSLLAAACAGGDGAPQGTAGPEATTTPTTPAATPGDGISALTPPLEGPPRIVQSRERTNYRDLAEYQLPLPEELPEPPGGADAPEFHPPAEPQCPEDWEELSRPGEGFKICYPNDWQIEGHGYVSAASDDRWYSVAFVLFQDDIQVAHVSVYVILSAFTQPFTYTRDCEQAYRVTFAGRDAVLCPDLSGQFPEAKIITYHARRDDFDYFVNIVPYLQYDDQAGRYLDTWSEEAEATAIQVAHTLQFIEILTPR
jgi:hypothetical protein